MSSSAKPPERGQPLVAEAGVRAPVPPPVDPFRVLDDLMAAVEALCPIWPERESCVGFGKMLL
jgi:hypothetical protein